MAKKSIKSKLSCYSWIILAIFAFSGLSAYGCSSMKGKPEELSILATLPMDHTSISSYLSIDSINKSDNEILLVAVWGRVGKSEGHTIAWEILDSNGDKVFSLEKDNFTIRPHVWSYCPVSMKSLEKSKVFPGPLIVRFYVDGNLALTKNIKCEDREIAGKDNQRVVVLPFIEYSDYPWTWPEESKNFFQNTVADAMYCEVARIFSDAIPHYIAEQKIGKIPGMGCYNSMECMSDLKDIFGESVFLFGELYIQKVFLDASSLTVYVCDPNKNKVKKFHFFQCYGNSYSSLMHDLLKGVAYKQGLIKYLVER